MVFDKKKTKKKPFYLFVLLPNPRPLCGVMVCVGYAILWESAYNRQTGNMPIISIKRELTFQNSTFEKFAVEKEE